MKFSKLFCAFYFIVFVVAITLVGCSGGGQPTSTQDVGDDESSRAAPVLSKRRGVQAVFLNYWGDKSCDNLISVINDYKKSGPTLDTFEIALAPYLKQSASDNSAPDVSTSYKNIKRILNEIIADDTSGAHKPVVTIHFSFHAGSTRSGSNKDAPSPAQMEQRGADFAKKFLVADNNHMRVNWIISPSLEDEYKTEAAFTSDVKSIIKGILTSIDDKDIRRTVASAILYRRSRNLKIGSKTMGYTAPRSLSQRITLADGTQLKYSATLEGREAHGVTKERSLRDNEVCKGIPREYKIYSNDGRTVYSEGEGEDRNTGNNAANEDSNCKYELGEFSSDSNSDLANNTRKVVLLWRHPYNLFYKENSKFTRADREKAYDMGGNSAFSDEEKAILRNFLGI